MKKCSKCKNEFPLDCFVMQRGKPSSWCKVCRKAARPDKETARKLRRYYYWKDHQASLIRDRAYRKSRPEKEAEKAKRYRHKNPLKFKERSARQKARKLGQKPPKVDYSAILERDNGLCHVCGLPAVDPQFDHVVAFINGGLHEESNIKVSCAHCNLVKGDRPRNVTKRHKKFPFVGCE